MKIRYRIALLLVMLVNVASAQISVSSFKVLDQYLQDGKVLIKHATPSTEIKIEVMFVSSLDNQGYANPANIKTRLATGNANGQVVYLSAQETITNADFPRYTGSITKVFTLNIDKSKLTSGIVLSLLTQRNGQLEGSFTGKYYHYVLETPPVVAPQYAINISSVSKVETVLIGTDCGFQHAYGTSFNPNGHMENGVWKFAYDINYTKSNPSVADSDIYWEWVVSDYSNFPITEKQFLVYPYAGTKYGPFNGEKKVFVEANDFLDEYDSKVTVRAKSRSTGTVYSKDYTFYFTAVNH